VGDAVAEFGEGIDEVRTGLAAYSLTGLVENLTGLSASGQELAGNSLDNIITGAAGNDTLRGFDGNDTLIGGGGNDLLVGGAGNDVLDGGTGADRMEGGLGNDIYFVDHEGDVTAEFGDGIDEVRTTLAAYALTGLVENLTGLLGTGQDLAGNSLDNVITGGAGNDTLRGRDGNDTLFGGSGNDILFGGTGNDTMRGGTGDDIYHVEELGDLVIELAGQGTDEVRTTLSSYTLGANVERVTGMSASGHTLTGNALHNAVKGGSGNDSLFGGDGNDWIEGGAGNDLLSGDRGRDTLFGGSGADTFKFNTGDSGNTLATADRIMDFLSSQGDKIDLSGWDANSAAEGHQAFTFVGGNAFGGVAGELRFVQDPDGSFHVLGDTNGDGAADFLLIVSTGAGQSTLTGSDFILGG
jgi:Ca2+-binding RTX toxin-like protein